MASVQITLESGLSAVIESLNQPMAKAPRELMVLELYPRRTIWSGKQYTTARGV